MIVPLEQIDGIPLGNELPAQLVEAIDWAGWEDKDNEDIRLLDFGESFYQEHKPKRLAQPGSLKVPETILTDYFDYRVDLWRTGCMVYEDIVSLKEICLQRYKLQIYFFLFTTWPFFYIGGDHLLITQMIGLVEKLPAEWEPKWKSISKIPNDNKPEEGN